MFGFIPAVLDIVEPEPGIEFVVNSAVWLLVPIIIIAAVVVVAILLIRQAMKKKKSK